MLQLLNGKSFLAKWVEQYLYTHIHRNKKIDNLLERGLTLREGAVKKTLLSKQNGSLVNLD